MGNASDAQAVAEKLVEAEPNVFSEEAPKAEQQGEAPKAEGTRQTALEAAQEKYEYQWREKAQEAIKNFYKGNPKYEDVLANEDKLNDLVYEHAAHAAKKIQMEVEARKAREKELIEKYSPYENYYNELTKNEYIQALYNGKARIVMAEDEQRSEETPEWIKPIYDEVRELKKQIVSREQAEKAELQRRYEETQKAYREQATDREIQEVARQFPEVKRMMEDAKRTGMFNPALDEIIGTVEAAEREGKKMSLMDATKLYYFDHNLPKMQEQVKQNTIQRFKQKAANNTETGVAPAVAQDKGWNTTDPAEVARRLIESLENNTGG